MSIRYEAYTADGQKVSGTLPVETPEAAEEMLWRSNLVITSLRRQGSLRKDLLKAMARQMPTFFRPRPQELVGFTRELGTLLKAGIPLYQSLTILQDRLTNVLLKDAVERITTEIGTGASFSDTISKYPLVFPSLYSRLLTVGEETGEMEGALAQVADYLERQSTQTQKVVSALRYPAIVMVMGIASGFLLVTFSLPALGSLLKEYGGELPIMARILVNLADVLNRIGKWLLLGLVLGAVALGVYFRTQQGLRVRDFILFRIPVVGKVLLVAAMFRFTSGLSTMLKAGLPLVEALTLTARVVPNVIIQEQVYRIREGVLGGQSLSQALARQPAFPAFVAQMVAVGEQAGTLTENLQSLAAFFGEETEQAISNLTGLIEPTLMVGIGGGVGLIAIAMFQALYGTLGQIR